MITSKDSKQIAYALGDALGQVRLGKGHLQRRREEVAVWRTADTIADYLEEYKGFSRVEFKQTILDYARIGTENQVITHKQFLTKALGLPVECGV